MLHIPSQSRPLRTVVRHTCSGGVGGGGAGLGGGGGSGLGEAGGGDGSPGQLQPEQSQRLLERVAQLISWLLQILSQLRPSESVVRHAFSGGEGEEDDPATAAAPTPSSTQKAASHLSRLGRPTCERRCRGEW